MAEELHSRCCDECNLKGDSCKIYYSKCLNGVKNSDFFYDEEGRQHCHTTDGGITYYRCHCSNDHIWNEYPIYKCLACNWQSSDKFVKWTDKPKEKEKETEQEDLHNEDDSFDTPDSFLISLYLVTAIFTQF